MLQPLAPELGWGQCWKPIHSLGSFVRTVLLNDMSSFDAPRPGTSVAGIAEIAEIDAVLLFLQFPHFPLRFPPQLRIYVPAARWPTGAVSLTLGLAEPAGAG